MANSEPQLDIVAMRRLAAGDLDALGELFERHHRRIYGFFRRMSGSVTVGEDLTQEVFLRVLSYRASFDPARSFEAWLYRIASNIYKDHRSAGRAITLEPVEQLDERAADDPAAGARLDESETRASLQRAILRLPHTQREALILARFEDLPYAAIARILGCTEGAVKLRVHRALRELETLLAAERKDGSGWKRGSTGISKTS